MNVPNTYKYGTRRGGVACNPGVGVLQIGALYPNSGTAVDDDVTNVTIVNVPEVNDTYLLPHFDCLH